VASDAIALMGDLGIRKAHLLGWIDGAIIGLGLAIKISPFDPGDLENRTC
jgi:hypothetical protein